VIHYAATETRGLVVYDNGTPIIQATDPVECERIARAMLEDAPLEGHQLPRRIRLGIARAALDVALRPD
jgi:hypothetical protein